MAKWLHTRKPSDGDRRVMRRCAQVSANQRFGALGRRIRASFTSGYSSLLLPTRVKGTILASKSPGIWRMSAQRRSRIFARPCRCTSRITTSCACITRCATRPRWKRACRIACGRSTNWSSARQTFSCTNVGSPQRLPRRVTALCGPSCQISPACHCPDR